MISDSIKHLLEIYQKEQRRKLEISNTQLTPDIEKHINSPEFIKGINPEKAQSLADKLFHSSKALENKAVLLNFDIYNLEVAAYIFKQIQDHNLEVDFDIVNPIIQSHILNNSTEDQIKKYSDHILKKYQKHKNYLIIKCTNDPEIITDIDKKALFQKFTKEITERCKSGDAHYTLTIIPKKHDAELDQIPYEKYLNLFFEACDQPWNEIYKAQEYLISKFNQASSFKVTTDEGTDIEMSIKDFTFANSTILKNIPGSEIFSAPQKESVNGTFIAKGKFQCRSSVIIEDIQLKFTNGKVTEIKAEKGQEELERIIYIDDAEGEGSSHIGELGIGTNPHIRKHLLNGLLVEKISGSFHLALGSCYTYEVYDGKEVNMNNGNDSANKVHWDITCMLRGNNGEMYLDNELIQKNGLWLDPELEVLNKGWGAMEAEKQPDWWKENYPQGYLN